MDVTWFGVAVLKTLFYCLMWMLYGGPNPLKLLSEFKVAPADIKRYERLHTDKEELNVLRGSVKDSLARARLNRI